MKNKLKQILASKRPAIGTWIAIPDVYAVEMIAGLGFDWLLVDMEHIPISKETLRAILMAVKGSDSVPIVRVASATVENFQSALDLGAQGSDGAHDQYCPRRRKGGAVLPLSPARAAAALDRFAPAGI